MRYLRALVFVIWPTLLAPTFQSVSARGTVGDVGASLDARFAISISYVQLWLTLSNEHQSLVAIPTCGEFEICGEFAFLEQRDGRKTEWRRTVPIPSGDASFGKLITLKKGESSHMIFRFHPNDWMFPDGSRIRYPGRVRLVALVWTREDEVAHVQKALELVSKEFSIPPPPKVWPAK